MDPVTLCNDALALVGDRVIMSLDDNSTAAALCRRFFRKTVREVLRDGVWHFARKRVVLSPMAEPPLFGWARQYTLPGDFMRMVEINGRGAGEADCPRFTIEARTLLMGDDARAIADGAPAGELRLVYIRDVTEPSDPGMWGTDVLFDRACAIALAAKMAWPLQQNRALRESLEASYEAAISKARSASTRDAFEKQRSNFDGSGSWIMAGRVTG